MAKRVIYQGEAKSLPFLVKSRRTGKEMDLSTATLLLWIKANQSDPLPVVVKTDSDFDKTLASVGKVNVLLAAYDTMQEAGIYYGELKISMYGEIFKCPFEVDILHSDSPNDWVVVASAIGSQEAFGTVLVQ